MRMPPQPIADQEGTQVSMDGEGCYVALGWDCLTDVVLLLMQSPKETERGG